MNLYLNGAELDASVEHELEGKDFGFNATLLHTDGTIEKLFNLTEVHHLYPSAMSEHFGGQIAFESDIHSTGKTMRLSELASVLVVTATSRADDYYGGER
jgi:hypothetical protein